MPWNYFGLVVAINIKPKISILGQHSFSYLPCFLWRKLWGCQRVVWEKKNAGFMLNVRVGFNLDFLALAWFCKWHVESCICFLWLGLFAAEEEGAIIFTLVLTTLLLIRLYYEYYCIIHKFSPRPKSWSKWTVPICMQENHFNYLKNITSSFRVAISFVIMGQCF